MKNFKILIFIGALLIMPVISYAQEGKLTKQEITSTDTLKFTIYGMDCPGCEGGLEKQVNKIPAVQYCKANWVKQELNIVVKQDSSLNIAELEKRVKKANFTLDKNIIKNED